MNAMKGGKRKAPVTAAHPRAAAAVPPLLSQAFNLFKAGRLQEAERAYATLVVQQPRLAVAHNHLGLIAKALGQTERAVSLLQRAVELDPNDPSGHTNLGNLLLKLGRAAEADDSYGRALALTPDSEDALLNKAWSQYSLGNGEGALSVYERAAAKYPASPRAHNGVGLALSLLGRTEESEAAFARALGADGRFVAALNNLGVLLKRVGRYDEACDAYRRALAIDRGSIEAYNNLGCALQEMGRLDEAKAMLKKALELAPTYADAMGNLGNGHLAALELDAAIDSYQRAAAMGTVRSDFRLHKAFVHLLRGEFAAGWDDYEARLSLPELAVRFKSVKLPRWDGAKLDGKLLVLEEQGLGDTLQFLRFIPRVAAMTGGVVLLVSPALRRLVPSWPGVEFYVEGQPLPRCTAWIPLLSIPRAMKLDLDTFGMAEPYLSVPPDVLAGWVSRLNGPDFKVGLVWAGSTGHKRDRERSIAPTFLEPLFRIPRLKFFSLQKVHAPGALETLRGFGPIEDLSADLGDMADTGGAARAMDLVISVDTSVAHLAGALRVPVWTLIAYSPDWRWQLERTDNPWYPSLRLFRQPAPGAWRETIADVAAALADRLQMTQGSER
jgi:tetratricopeptide (TPR) repeat protein